MTENSRRRGSSDEYLNVFQVKPWQRGHLMVGRWLTGHWLTGLRRWPSAADGAPFPLKKTQRVVSVRLGGQQNYCPMILLTNESSSSSSLIPTNWSTTSPPRIAITVGTADTCRPSNKLAVNKWAFSFGLITDVKDNCFNQFVGLLHS